VLEAYLKEVAHDTEGFLRKLDITVFPKALATPPQDDRFFAEAQIASFANELREWDNAVARERDVLSIALVMRRRRGHKSNDVFETKYVFLSHNPVLVRHARQFCLEEFLIRDVHVPPAIDQRRMAVLLWLTLGSVQRLDLSRRQLIANCSNALRSRPDVIQSMRDMLGSVKPELKSQFDALLTRPRSVQVVMDLTLGVHEVVGPDQIEKVFEIVKSSAIEMERAKFDEEIKATRTKLGRTISAKDTAIASLQEASDRIKSELDDAKVLDRRMVKSWVGDCARRGARLYFCLRVLITLIAAIIFFGAGAGIWAVDSLWGRVFGLLAALIALVAAVWGIWIHSNAPMISRIHSWQTRDLRKHATESGREDLLPYIDVDWNTQSVSWCGKYGPDEKEEGRLPSLGARSR
jgi:hypothetical protein